MLHIVTLILITLGTALLFFSIRKVNIIYRKDANIGWRALRVLVIFFIVANLGVFYYFYLQISINTPDIIVGLIMVGVGGFVFQVTRFCLQNLVKLEKLSIEERNNSLHDSLTGLPNRQFLMESLQQLVEEERPFSLFIIDLNRFKQINDAFGHYYGDLLLIQIGERITKALPPSNQIYRLGGDEFALITRNADTANIQHVVEIIHFCLEATFEVESYELSIGASVGVTYFPANSRDLGTLLQQADLAMYASKKHSNVFTEYNESLQTGAAEKVNIASQLKIAIQLQQFELWYQPIIDLKTGEIHGAEALIRWPRPDGSFIPPDKFIKIAEQSALITRISDWVIHKVTEDISYFTSKGLDLRIHINLSVKDLQDVLIAPKLRKILDKHTTQAHQLMLEITESAMMTDISQVKKTMTQISEAGLVFSIDDFGTGYSSLALLRDLPVGQIKIDRSFITHMANNKADLAIVKSTIYLGQNLECNVVAEGVEDAEAEALLIELGCDYAQGYYYSKPKNIDDFIEYLQKYNNDHKLTNSQSPD